MTDNDIIKALECCLTYDCDNCPFNPFNCDPNLQEYAIDIINRQKAEIESLKESIQYGNKLCEECQNDKEKGLQKARTEAIKEFAEEVSKEIAAINTNYVTDDKDDIVEQALARVEGVRFKMAVCGNGR